MLKSAGVTATWVKGTISQRRRRVQEAMGRGGTITAWMFPDSLEHHRPAHLWYVHADKVPRRCRLLLRAAIAASEAHPPASSSARHPIVGHPSMRRRRTPDPGPPRAQVQRPVQSPLAPNPRPTPLPHLPARLRPKPVSPAPTGGPPLLPPYTLCRASGRFVQPPLRPGPILAPTRPVLILVPFRAPITTHGPP